MKILNCTVENFGSYKNLSFDFYDQGLALVYGPTGAGKSTLQDIPSWILYGVTAKGGNADEICNWTATAPTRGTATVNILGTHLTVTRIRGAGKNDLYYTVGKEEPTRGKDMKDTQGFISSILGMDADQYTTAACFNEFSETGKFFLAKSKDRREVLEKVADLFFPAWMSENLSARLKTRRADLASEEKWRAHYSGAREQLKNSLNTLAANNASWETARLSRIDELERRSKSFERDKKATVDALEAKSYRFEADNTKDINELIDKLDSYDQKIQSAELLNAREKMALEALPAHCPACGQINVSSRLLDSIREEKRINNVYLEKFANYSERLREAQKHKNPYTESVERAKAQENHYAKQLEEQTIEINPFATPLLEAAEEYNKMRELKSTVEDNIKGLSEEISALYRLKDLCLALRGVLLKNTVKRIESFTNKYLDTYFDAEFKVAFDLTDADNLEVSITKNGHSCVYKQLSKGQRQLLRLCFSVSVMEAASSNLGVHLHTLMFDEALDGLDSDLKNKAYALFEHLATKHASVLLIDHDAVLQNMICNKYKVSMQGDESSVERE